MSAEKRCTLRSTSGRWILLATILASGVSFLAGTAVPVALPAIQARFNTALSGIQWVVNANLLSLGALILIGGALGDQYGRKRIFTLGIALFGVAALLSGLAPSIGALLGLQALQGVGSALMVPVSLAALCITFLFVPGIAPSESRKLDLPGAVAIVIGLLGLAYGLMTGPGAGWGSPAVLVSLAGGALATGLFVFIETHQRQPLVYLSIFRDPLVAGANVVTLLVYFGLNGVTFFTVLNLQQVRDYSPTEAGLALLPPIVLITFLTWLTGALADRIGPRLQMILGPLLVSAGMALLTTGGINADYLRHFLPGLALFGAGMAVVIPPLTKCALSVEPRFSGSASGINNGIARVAGLLAIAILGAVVIPMFHTRLAAELSQSDLTEQDQQQILAQADKLGGIVIPDTFTDAARQEALRAVRSAFIYGFRRAMAACSVLAFGAAMASVALIRNNTNKLSGGAT